MEIILALVGAVIVYLIMGNVYAKYWFKNLYVDVDFSAKYAEFGDKIFLYEIVTNNKILPVPMVNIKFQIDKKLKFVNEDTNSKITDKGYKNDIFSLLFYQKITRTIPIECKHRGCYSIDEIEMVSKGFWSDEIMSLKCRMNKELIVYPKRVDTDRIMIPYKKIMGDIIAQRYICEDPFLYRGIREYDSQDSQSLINWKATAKTGDLKVNIHDFSTSQEVCIMLNLDIKSMLSFDDLLEESISIASSLAEAFIKRGISVSLISNGSDLGTENGIHIAGNNTVEHFEMVNRTLATVDLSRNKEPFVDTLEKSTIRKAQNTVFIIICADTNGELKLLLDNLRFHCSNATLILPYFSGEGSEWKDFYGENILHWEVRHDV